MWRTFVVLGRVSNLPTVWSNCAAAWLIAGGSDWTRFALVCAGASLLYTGGMWLNDAFDSRFDARFRPERPIPSGTIPAKTVFLLGALMLGAGILVIALTGRTSGFWAAGLSLCIVLYDAVHKKTALAPALMALCRFLLYVTAASAAPGGITAPVLLFGAVLAIYIVGVSVLARHESTDTRFNYAAAPLLFTPAIAALWTIAGRQMPLQALFAAGFVAWLLWCLQPVLAKRPAALGRAVPGLLAGIILVDLLAARHAGTTSIVFPLLFASALILQKLVPAT
jgi:4-hydroxybenzoate polyprenyltransferase